MAKLCQMIAVANGAKSQTEKDIASIYHMVQKPPLLNGQMRVYTPKDEDGEQLPAEVQKVQFVLRSGLAGARKAWTRLFDVVATQDLGNCSATGSIVVEGVTVLHDVPVTHLLFLEKRLVDIRTFIEKVPVLDPGMDWEYDDAKGVYVSKAVKQTRTRKVQKPIVLYDATEHHPAQTQLVVEDVIDGYWQTTHFSTAMPADEKRDILERVSKLQKAVKFAREEANSAEVEDMEVGDAIFDFIFGS